ncbi:MAG: hypothetical protein P8Y71_30510 [Pseudolabrys sp.]
MRLKKQRACQDEGPLRGSDRAQNRCEIRFLVGGRRTVIRHFEIRLDIFVEKIEGQSHVNRAGPARQGNGCGLLNRCAEIPRLLDRP